LTREGGRETREWTHLPGRMVIEETSDMRGKEERPSRLFPINGGNYESGEKEKKRRRRRKERFGGAFIQGQYYQKSPRNRRHGERRNRRTSLKKKKEEEKIDPGGEGRNGGTR